MINMPNIPFEIVVYEIAPNATLEELFQYRYVNSNWYRAYMRRVTQPIDIGEINEDNSLLVEDILNYNKNIDESWIVDYLRYAIVFEHNLIVELLLSKYPGALDSVQQELEDISLGQLVIKYPVVLEIVIGNLLEASSGILFGDSSLILVEEMLCKILPSDNLKLSSAIFDKLHTFEWITEQILDRMLWIHQPALVPDPIRIFPGERTPTKYVRKEHKLIGYYQSFCNIIPKLSPDSYREVVARYLEKSKYNLPIKEVLRL